MLFEILCYAVAIVGTLAFFGNPTPATAIEAPQPQTSTEAHADLASILASMTSTELRRECSAAGIRWRNARGQGKHLTKAAMVEAMVAALAA